MEKTCAGVLIFILSPLLLTIWITTFFLCGRSPLIAHKRVGRNGSDLWLLKFRTMWKSRARFHVRELLSVEYIDDQTGPSLKSQDDPRVWSRFARFCRCHSLDELPQLVHVLRGQMSLVGPRPVTALELVEMYGSNADEVVKVKPGLSGLWQVSGRNRLTAIERCRLDLECVRDRSVGAYFRILMRTVPEIFTGESAW